MADGLSFSLEEMRQLAADVNTQETIFANGVEEIKTIVEEIHSLWTSEETGTYEAFKALFDEKYPSLEEADSMMKSYYQLIDQKADDF